MSFGFPTLYSEARSYVGQNVWSKQGGVNGWRSYVGQNGWSKQQEDEINARLADVLADYKIAPCGMIKVFELNCSVDPNTLNVQKDADFNRTTQNTFLLLSWCFMSTETIRLIRDGQMEVGEEGHYLYIYIYLSLHCHHQNDFLIKMSSDESHFNVSLSVRDKVTRQCPQTTTLEER